MNFQYDVIVIGAGHAGCEAACAAANMGSKTLLITMDMNKIAEFIKKSRKEAGLTQEQFAMRSGLGLRFIRELEQGKETVRMDKVNAKSILQFFNDTANVSKDLVGDIDIMEKLSFVDVSEKALDMILKKSSGKKMGNRKVKIEVSNVVW